MLRKAHVYSCDLTKACPDAFNLKVQVKIAERPHLSPYLSFFLCMNDSYLFGCTALQVRLLLPGSSQLRKTHIAEGD